MSSSKVHAWQPPAPSRATRHIPLRSKGSFRGALVAPFANGRSVVFESRLELKVAYTILARKDVVDLWDQPPAVSYFSSDGKRRTHTFDFLATLVCGKKIAIAVKPADRAERLRLKNTLKLIAEQLPDGYADEVALITDRSLTKAQIANAAMVHHFRRHQDLEADNAMTKLIRAMPTSVSIGELVAASRLGGRGFRAVVRQIASGHLQAAGSGRIDYDTLVVSREARL